MRADTGVPRPTAAPPAFPPGLASAPPTADPTPFPIELVELVELDGSGPICRLDGTCG